MMMFAKINAFLAGLPMTVAAGAFLLLNLAANINVEANGVSAIVRMIPFNTAWLSIVICTIPIIWHTLHRIVRHHGLGKISASLFVFIAIAAAVIKGDLLLAGTAGFVTAIYTLLEDALIHMSRNGVKTLLSLVPTRARRIENGDAVLIPAEEMRIGDSLRVMQGETIPADGTIIRGQSAIDQSALTGGFLAVNKGVGDEVYCGTINKTSSIDITATKIGEEDSLHKLIRIVKEAENDSPVYRTADRFSFIILPAAVILAAASGIMCGSFSAAVTSYVLLAIFAVLIGTFWTVATALRHVTKRGVVFKYEKAVEEIKNSGTPELYANDAIEYGNLSFNRVSPFGLTTGQLRLIALATAAEVKRASREIQACSAENNVPSAE